MPLDETDLAAAEHVLGVTTPDEREAALARLETDPALREAVAGWEQRLAPLVGTGADMAPPPGLLAAIEARLDGEGPRLPDTRTVRAQARQWRTIGPGVTISILAETSAPRRQTLLMRCLPGALFPEHEHEGDEELLVLEGDIAFGSLELKAGDFHAAPRGGRHPLARTRAGCLLLVTIAH